MLFRNKQKEIESRIEEYIRQASECIQLARTAITDYCGNGDRESLAGKYGDVHRVESLADDIVVEISDMLFSESLFPESRGAILELLENMDSIPNHAESAVRMILYQHIEITSEYSEGIIELLNTSCKAGQILLQAASKLFSNFTAATVDIGKVDQSESEADLIEARLIKSIFSSQLEGCSKLLLRDLTQHISQIADRAEVAGKRIRLIIAKRCI